MVVEERDQFRLREQMLLQMLLHGNSSSELLAQGDCCCTAVVWYELDADIASGPVDVLRVAGLKHCNLLLRRGHLV